MGHPGSAVDGDSRLTLLRTFIGKLLLSSVLLLSSPIGAAEPAAQAALSSALQATPAAGVVVDIASGRQVAAVGATTRVSTPGSILKPLFLSAALERREVLPQTTVFCRRSLHITEGGREWDLACTHPQSDVAFAAKEALAYSCNSYFASVADRMPPSEVAGILDHYGLTSGSLQPSREQKELLVLGVAGIAVSPVQMAAAYRKLALALKGSGALDALRDGLKDSVDYGMAHNAAVPGQVILGKTGTASDPGASWSHGWFAGIGYLGREEVVLVIYLPRGNGADAARLAQHFFLAGARAQ